MSKPTVSLPILESITPLRLTPTDISQFVRVEQCERYLRFRIAERARQKFMEEYDVIPQRVTPLLSQSGESFEEDIETLLQAHFRTINYAELAGHSHARQPNNSEVCEVAQHLNVGETVLLLQPRLAAVLCGWRLRGDVDLLKLQRLPDGSLQVLITDMKSTTKVKVEHRLQVAFYRLMLEDIFSQVEITHNTIEMAILLRPPVDPTPEEQEESEPLQVAAEETFHLQDALLQVVSNPEAYLQSVYDLVLSKESTARRVAETQFAALPYCLSFKCDDCLYNEFCMKWSAETEDLSLLPYMTGTEKEALRRNGVRTVSEVANLKEFVADGKELATSTGNEETVKQLASTWPVGPRLDELIHRAKSFSRVVLKEETPALTYIPGKGNSSLPVSTPDLNPNLVRIYLDAQQDYLEGRVYLLGALIVACDQGEPVATRSVVQMTDGPPDSQAKEQDLLTNWTHELVEAIVDLAVPTDPSEDRKSAPIHVIFFDRYEQRLMLEALARNFPPIIDHTPPLYDFLTQIAAFDSPIASFLDDEIRVAKNFPMTCQSLQSVSTFLKFDWNTPLPFRERFRPRMFDYIGKREQDGESTWFTKRSRFSSSIPLEHAYATWDQLPVLKTGKGDEFADFRETTRDELLAFETRRLEALEQIANSIRGNPNTQKTPFDLPDLANYEDIARNLAQALHEFLTIERFVELSEWKTTRHLEPERRVLLGDALLVQYCDDNQAPGVAEQNNDNTRRQQLKEEYTAEFRANNPGQRLSLTKEQKAECKWSSDGLQIRLRLETEDLDCDVDEVLTLSNLRAGDRMILFPRWTVDGRLPDDQQQPFTPTPKQMLYGQRADLVQILPGEKDGAGRLTSVFVDVELKDAFGGASVRPYAFGAFPQTLDNNTLYTLDPCPDSWYGYWCHKVVEGMRNGEPNTLYDRLENFPAPGDAHGSPGQQRFLNGLEALAAAGLLHDFEDGKRAFIGSHAQTPVLLVQGPPGTGKSYSTAFAVFARLQAALQEQRPCRVFLSCKTHAATDVLLKNVLEVQEKLRELQTANPELFETYFDDRLLNVPLYRVAGKEPSPGGIVSLSKDREKSKGEPKNGDLVSKEIWCVAGITPGGIYGMLKDKWAKKMFQQEFCELLVLDEASQMNLPEALMAAMAFSSDGQLIVVGDHRQMPPIVKHDWDGETRRTFQQYQVYASLFDTLRELNPPLIQFAESFRLHQVMAEYLREEVYRHDGIDYHSQKTDLLPELDIQDQMVAAILDPRYPLVVVVHEECQSQVLNPFEQELIAPILRTLAHPEHHGLDADVGMGIVVPHRAQRAAMQQSFPELSIADETTGLPVRSAIDTVERFQGGERTVILVSATESDRAYLLASSKFLLDPRRLTVALSRAKRKMILVASRSIFSMFSPDEETFNNSLLWKNLLLRTCTTLLWEGEQTEKGVQVWGGEAMPVPPVP